MKTIKFNTGRHYTAAGQRIIATLYDDGVVTFHDIDRMITGEITAQYDGHITKQRVMDDYDNLRYKNTNRAWTDGMMRGAVNAKWED